MVLTGVIRPPPEIRAVANRTALYVAKNGRAFEARILGSEKGKTPKFSFLHETSPFHAYYEQRIQFYESGGNDESEKQQASEKNDLSNSVKESQKPKVKATTITSVIDPVAKVFLEQRSKISSIRSQSTKSQQTSTLNESEIEPSPTIVMIPSPTPLNFVNVVAPSSITTPQLEVIQCSAMFTALERNFLLQLSSREWNNPEFAFCQPRNPHFAYFSALVDAYRSIIRTWTSPSEAGSKEETVMTLLERAAYRAAYELDNESQQKDHEVERLIIDWHDFVVVETIEFAKDEVIDLSMVPPPPPPPPLPSSRPLSLSEISIKIDSDPVNSIKSVDDMEESEDEDEEQIRLVPNYQPRVAGGGNSSTNDPYMMIDPITGKSVAVQDMPEHMRIQLLDPKWAEERKKFLDKQKDTNFVSNDEIASNLERLAAAKGGGYKDHDFLMKEADSKSRLAEANRVIREQGDIAMGSSNHTPIPPLQQQQQQQQQPAIVLQVNESILPLSKRPRIDKVTNVEAPPLPSALQLRGYTGSRFSFDPSLPGLPSAEPSAVHDETKDMFMVGGDVGTSASSSIAAAPTLLSESEFAATLPDSTVNLLIRIPNDPTQTAWNFYGQTVSLAVDVMSSVKSVKSSLSTEHLNKTPPNKIQLKSSVTGAFLKDSMTLAALNIGPSASLEVVPRARGGRK